MAVKLKDIAKIADVSEATVSLALNGNTIVNIETRKRIIKIADELGYVPNPYARKLALNKSGMFGLIIPDIENFYYASFVNYINKYTRRTNYGLSIAISENSRKIEANIISEMIVNRVEGLFIVPVNKPNQDIGYFSRLDEAGIPYIFTTSKYDGIDGNCIMCDLKNGMYELIKFLFGRGYKKITYISGPKGVYTLDLRESGYREAINDDNNIIHREFFCGEVTYNEACDVARYLIENKIDTDVIVCVNDTMAIGVVNTLNSYGINVPDDIAVCGFDNIIFSTTSAVSLTTVEQDIESEAKQSVELLLNIINKKASVKDNEIIIPTKLIIRNSTK